MNLKPSKLTREAATAPTETKQLHTIKTDHFFFVRASGAKTSTLTATVSQYSCYK